MPGSEVSEQERRRLARFPTWCITSIAYGSNGYASARVLDVSWSGIGISIERDDYPRLEMLLELNSLGPLRLGIVKGRWGTLRARADVVRADFKAGCMRLGLAVHWADPQYYDFVRTLGSARGRLN